MDIGFITRHLDNLWQFILDNPEISLAIIGAIGTIIAGLFRICFRWWKRRKRVLPPYKSPSLLIRPLPAQKSEVWFVNVGEHRGHLTWEDCIQYGCIGTGGGTKYRDDIQKLKDGDTVYAYITGEGYVGYGHVVEEALPIRDFTFGKTPLLKKALNTKGLERCKDDLELSEYVVRMYWLKTYPRTQARWHSGLFVYRGTLCRFTDPETLEFLRIEFQSKVDGKERCYSKLDLYLREKLWQAANEETHRLLITESKEGESYLGVEELMNLPCELLMVIDSLWVEHSERKFGFSVQKEIYIACGGIPDGHHHLEAWDKFCDDVNWPYFGRQDTPLTFNRFTSPRGYFPFPSKDIDVLLPFEDIGSNEQSRDLGNTMEILFSRLKDCEA